MPPAIDQLEHVVGGAYQPGAGVRGGLANQVRAASAHLTAFEITGRLPYSMLAEELMQTARRVDPDRASPTAFLVHCDAARVFCRLAALHDDADYRKAAVILSDADYRGDAARILAAQSTRLVDAPAAHAAKKATATIPIVISVADPLATGLVASLARPGGNLTGVSSSGPDLAGKRLELLRELRPELARVAFLGAANDPNVRTFLDETQAAADSTRVRLQPVLVTRAEEFDAAFATMLQDQAQGLIVQPLFVGHRAKLAELATRHRLPMVADQRTFVAVGGLAAYGVNRSALSRRWAYYVDKILKGAKPADLPIELPTTFELGNL